MKISEAEKLWLEYHKSHSKENTMRTYKLVIPKFCTDFGGENLEEITTEKVLAFLNRITEGRKLQTKRTRYFHLLTFFNFIKNNLEQEFRNPCDTPILKNFSEPDELFTGTSSRRKPLMRLFSEHQSQEIG